MDQMTIGLNSDFRISVLIEGVTILLSFITKSKTLIVLNKFRLYIYGGHDIREGSKDSLWVLDLRKLKDLDLDST